MAEPSESIVAVDVEPALRVQQDGKNAAAIKGISTNEGGAGVHGVCTFGDGVHGNSTKAAGVAGHGVEGPGVFGASQKSNGVQGHSTEADAVHGLSTKAAGVAGKSTDGVGVFGQSQKSNGVQGHSTEADAIHGTSTKSVGVKGESEGDAGVIGVSRANDQAGVRGFSFGERGVGVWGESLGNGFQGVVGISTNSAGVHGISTKSIGVKGESKGEEPAIYGQGKIAGRFDGEVLVTGDIRLLNADCAEDFDMSDSELKSIEAGTVMVLTEKGSLQSSYQEYDKKVAGIVSGASGYKPAIVLDRQEQQGQSQNNKDRLPIALMGKVYCKVDARHSPIEIGDLLTTSSTTGYAMKVEDPMKGFGAVVGMALGTLKEGVGMIPVLVALQ